MCPHACLIRLALLGFALLSPGQFVALAQSPEERARIGRLQQAQQPCPAQPRTEAERLACQTRAITRELGHQDGFCWPAPNQTQNSPAYLCDSKRRR